LKDLITALDYQVDEGGKNFRHVFG
jgi:hypothetical protein